jgi:hypothetical protein
MKLRLSQAVLTLSSVLAVGCGQMPEHETDVAQQREEVGQLAQLLRNPNRVPGEYIVVLHEDMKPVAQRGAAAIAQEMSAAHGFDVTHVYEHALKGFAVRMPEARVQRLLADSRVKYVEENGTVEAINSQSPATWGIDRVDQRNLPLNNTYNYNHDGSGAHAYIIDTGVLLAHQEFTGRMGNGFDAVTSGGNANDCNGHGTHVAGTVAGTVYGIAKKAIVHPVRVLGCNGSGTNAGVISGMDWVTGNHIKPAVANMSLGGGASQATDDAVQRMFAAGVSVAVAAGNDNKDACGYSPARAPNAITVGSTTNTDARSSFSNWGTCLDIFAPGSSITAAWHTSNTATNTISGTSMASPHVAGAAVLYVAANPNATPQQVRDALVNNGTPNKVTSAGTGSPNVLLFTGFIGGGTPPPGDTTPPTTSITAPSAGSTVSGTVTYSANASDNVGVTRVEFYVGSTLIATDTTSPYSISWNTANHANGGYSLTTRAYDAAGNVGTSSAASVTVSNGTGGNCSITEQLFGNPGFESGNTIWTATSGVIGSGTSGSAPRTGSWKAWLNGYGTTYTDTLYQQVTIPSSACSASLRFWLKITTSETTTTQAYDRLFVEVQNSSGAVLATLATYSNLNKGTSYIERSFDVSAYKGQTIRINFKGVEDFLYATSFFIDDTSLTITR